MCLIPYSVHNYAIPSKLATSVWPGHGAGQSLIFINFECQTNRNIILDMPINVLAQPITVAIGSLDSYCYLLSIQWASSIEHEASSSVWMARIQMTPAIGSMAPVAIANLIAGFMGIDDDQRNGSFMLSMPACTPMYYRYYWLFCQWPKQRPMPAMDSSSIGGGCRHW